MTISIQNKSIFSFLIIILLSLLIVQNAEAQWEILLKEEGQNWQYQDMQVGGDGGVLIIAQVENSYRLLRVNILGQVVWGFAFEELNLPDTEIINPKVQILPDSDFLLSYSADSLETHKRLARLNPYGKLIWTSDLEFYGAVIEMESGDYLQIVSVEVENVLDADERDIVATAINRENGSILRREVYATEVDEEIWKRKWTLNGNYMIAGKSDENHIFTMLFSDEGEHIGGYTYDFEGEELDIPEGNDGYQLSDIDITSDDGLIVIRIYKMKSSSHVYLYPYLTVEKFDRVGEVEWSNTYGYDLEDNYSFWSSCKHYIRQNFQNDYVIYGNFIVNGAQNIGTGKISQEGFFLWEEYYTNLAYNNPFSSTFTYLEPLEMGGVSFIWL